MGVPETPPLDCRAGFSFGLNVKRKPQAYLRVTQRLNGGRFEMRVVAMAAIITSLAAPALAQQGDSSKTEANKAEERKKKESDEVERAYQDMLKSTTHGQPAKKTGPWDPWRNSR
jgi:hypothetical protein